MGTRMPGRAEPESGGQPRSRWDLIRKYDVPGPRYTSYPTAVEFSTDLGDDEYPKRLAEADRASEEPLSLYVHLPFCEERCWFCGCNVVITRKHEVSSNYLDYLRREIDLLAGHLPNRRRLSQYHWGGGTPTYQTPAEMEALHRTVLDHFEVEPDAEVAVELDPRTTTEEHLQLLKRLKFNRISMGVQDFSDEVQTAVHRNQTLVQTRQVFDRCRSLGFPSINVDLIYGLPLQNLESFTRTMDLIVEMRPDRLAVYSFAHVPWIRPHQKLMDPATLPSPEVKLQLFMTAREKLLEAGYVQIGMDHFAVPDDEMAEAMLDRRLTRNFMGYTVRMGTDMVGVGISSIADVRGAYHQNARKLTTYYRALDQGKLPVERGYRLDRDDQVRRAVITSLMCNFYLDRGEIEGAFGIDFERYFARELEQFRAPGGPVEDGFLQIRPDSLEVVGEGRLFIRNVCMAFDRYLRSVSTDKPVFSRTV